MRTTVIVRQVFRNIKNQMMLIENLFSDIEIENNKEYVLELKEIRSIGQVKFEEFVNILYIYHCLNQSRGNRM